MINWGGRQLVPAELFYGCLSPPYRLMREAQGKVSLTIITPCLGCIRIIVLFRSLQDIHMKVQRAPQGFSESNFQRACSTSAEK